jgi:hypothetical protein
MHKDVYVYGAVVGAAVALFSLAGCAPGSLASEGAAQGAKSGALGGAVAGAVGSLFWGGNVVENMVAGAVVTAAAGAAVGGAAGASQDKAIEQQRDMSERDAALQQRLGPDNFAAARELALCKHKTAIGKARTAYGREQDPARKRYALMIESIANRHHEGRDARPGCPRVARDEPQLRMRPRGNRPLALRCFRDAGFSLRVSRSARVFSCPQRGHCPPRSRPTIGVRTQSRPRPGQTF